MGEILEAPGEPISRDNLLLPKARALAAALASEHTVYSILIECRRDGHHDVVVLEVEVERPQVTVHDIRARERLAVIFPPGDVTPPLVLALRSDFPKVPHLNLDIQEIPRNLCLYEQPYRDQKTRWTPERFVERIREWLALTAKGELHPNDQPLEPVLLVSDGHIFLPRDVLDAPPGSAVDLTLAMLGADTRQPVLIARTDHLPRSGRTVPAAIASVHRCLPRFHGVVEWIPRSLPDLYGIAERAGLDLRRELIARMRGWRDDNQRRVDLIHARIVIVLIFPRQRSETDPPEHEEVWAFLLPDAATVGEHMGLWVREQGNLCPLLGSDGGGDEAKIEVAVLNPSYYLTPALAATYGGYERPLATNMTAIGGGALGSHVILNLVRGGVGKWSLIDDDILMPHNLARHALHGEWLGLPKAFAVAYIANTLTYNGGICSAIVADVLAPGEKGPVVSAALESAEIILDMSASVSVSRSLSFARSSSGRRVSLFLSPTGNDLVLIAEGTERNPRLDELEMQYYRAIAQDGRLAGHLRGADVRRQRYGQSCRDLSVSIPQELVALHSALASRAVRTVVGSSEPRISVWRADELGNVTHVAIATATTKSVVVGDWTVSISEALIAHLQELRAGKLPRETGGVLLGTFDFAHHVAYVVDTVPSPRDSVERKTSYIRGHHDLRERVSAINSATDGMLEYVGEWHSHPRGTSTDLSSDDERLLHWIRDAMGIEGLPAVMLIAGDEEVTLAFAPPVIDDSVFVQVKVS